MSFLNGNEGIIFFFLFVWGTAFALLFLRVLTIKNKIKLKTSPLVFKAILRSTVLALLFVALSGPYLSEKKGTETSVSLSRDFLIALDLSHSMLANDLKPNRLERAKLFLKEVSQKLKGDNFGLVIFSSNAYIQCPLTYDTEYFNKMLGFAHPRLVPMKGTDLYPVLNTALDRLTHRDQIDSKSKIIILVSDGEDFGEEMIPIAEKIKDAGIKVYCVGIGTEAGGNIKLQKGFKRDYDGNLVNTKLNSRSLEKLASITNGEYFEISDSKYELNDLILSLDKIKGQKNSLEKRHAPKTVFYHYFLLVAFLLLIVDFIVKPKLIAF